MEKYLKNSDRKALELINRCQNQEEALELLTNFFGYIPAKLDIVCWVAFNALPNYPESQ